MFKNTVIIYNFTKDVKNRQKDIEQNKKYRKKSLDFFFVQKFILFSPSAFAVTVSNRLGSERPFNFTFVQRLYSTVS